ncbi:hypothetical protein LTR10_020428 [Elasticomyces elasticus]|uniref:Uncharacterized protein n=1 Tax=Exophiala sideris TaxID=1016849 RepID=A0ABR0J4A1_9EURO|nr:hypothetical protein LTR10_020428 [Elasticomyces elasticus]KAK5027047.1 hypothetical protein LTS07_007346 [Exophiala sideris]KAK5034051.1 hypothetical protein LTR13_006651 [Exophiala sideris]KAK5055673.1 hypothetical protein LTR69_008047 [Exophiala sideris]KAK5180993.1 hypothetical protein LTR44_006813 [Eurotiomycetes sp. CCFEE 6388]
MHFQRTTLSEQSASGQNRAQRDDRQARDSERPLTCMFFFFASQMKHNIQPADQDLVRRGKVVDQPTHKLDSMLARLEMHAAHSPLVTDLQTYPVEIPNAPGFSQRNSEPLREKIHDSVMTIKFRDRRAREEWIATKEWQDFMAKTEGEQVFRQMPHVRCASSMRGLMDPIDMLTA